MNNDIIGEVVELKDLIDYQSGSVVSRTIIKKGSGTVTVFAFDKDEGLSEHTAPFDAMVTILDGEAKIFISDDSHYVSKGETIIMPANKPHSLYAEKRFKMLLIMIKA